MYRAYKHTQTAAVAAAGGVVDQQNNLQNETKTSKGTSKDKSDDDDDNFDNNMQQEVKKIWSHIEKQCRDKETNQLGGDSMPRADKMLDLNTVHVFVSSTFTDFFNEREVLVKKVFPELREWCQNRGQKLLECDLRWGIPKDTSTADTILVCLDEIERCHQVNKGKPFFINLVGERYGWIPLAEEVPEEAREKYGWIDGSSITFMEVMHGAYRDQNPNAAFFLRNESILHDIPESFQSRFVDKEPLARLHLRMLKWKILERFPSQVFPYNCKFKQISNSTGREQVELTELDEFAEKVIHFLKGAIERTYPCSTVIGSEKDLQTQEADLQWMFALDKATDLIGRESELQILQEFVKNGNSPKMKQIVATDCGSSLVRKKEDWELETDDSTICVLEASSGWGKTALLCKLIVDTVKSGVEVFYHIVSSTPTSNRVESLLRRLLLLLTPDGADNEAIESDDVDELQKQLKTALAKYRKRSDKRLVIFIDGLNEVQAVKFLDESVVLAKFNHGMMPVPLLSTLSQPSKLNLGMLENSDTYTHLSWLPPSFPGNIHCILSTNLHPPTTARLYEHPTFKMTLQSMTTEELATVAVKYLQSYSKKLDASLLETLIHKTRVDNPFWMLMMMEELRIFGDFRVLNEKIDMLPDSMEALLVQIIDRLMQEDDDNEVIKKVLCLIACSRQGLPYDIILQICGNVKSKEELAPLYWARAHRQLKSYLRVFRGTEEVLTFSHEAVLKAVQGHLLTSREEAHRWHTVFADYYQFWCNDARTKAYHLPYHLEAAGLKRRLADFLRNDPDSYTHMNPWARSSLAKKARCHMMATENMASTAALMLCHSCSLRNRGYNPACTWQNKKCCVLCGSLCMGSNLVGARVCSRHSFKYLHKKCFLCNFLAGASGTQAVLCMHCGFGSGNKICACLDV